MDNTLTTSSNPDDSAELLAGIERIITEIEYLRRQMQSDQADIKRSRDRTRAMLAELSVQLKVV